MRLALSITLLLMLTATSQSPCLAATTTHPQLRDKWALLVGVDSFQDPSMPPNKGNANNVSDLQTVLQNPAWGRFAPDHLMVLTGRKATKSGIEHAIGDWLMKKALPDDLVFVYVSSASIQGPNGEPMVFSYDTLGSEPESSGIDLKVVADDLKRRIQSHNIVMMIDASPVGKAAPDFSKLTEPGVTVITAATGSQQSITNGALNRSIFEHHLSEAIKHGGGTLTVRQIFDYLASTVNADAESAFKSKQNPALAAVPSNAPTLEVALGAPVRNVPHKSFAVGHPIDQLALTRPDLMAGNTVGAPVAAATQAISVKGPASSAKPVRKDDDDDDDDKTAQAVDYGPYIVNMKDSIRKNWKPPKGLESRRVVAVFTILRDGRIVSPTIVESSGNPEVDKSAMDALAATSPLPPLPKGSSRSVDMKYKFEWNVH